MGASDPSTGESARPEQQRAVDQHFRDRAEEWQRVYGRDDVNALVHRERLTTALTWIDGLGLQAGAESLDLGCGAGAATVALAGRGLAVAAVDPVPEMLELTRHAAETARLVDLVTVATGDAHALPFGDARFDLVVALGVFPFLHSPHRATQEIARVLRPGGHLVTNADNNRRAIRFLEPLQVPGSATLRRSVRRALGRDPGGVRVTMHSIREFDELLARAGLRKITGRTLGFGPFTIMRRPVLNEERGRRLNDRLQRWADEGKALVRSMGAQYVVLARRDP
ncbi:MAG: class I SAM-dependent methyltransferase [Actinomycetota bacterium]